MFRTFSVLGSWLSDIFDRQQNLEHPRRKLTIVGYGWATHAFINHIDSRKYDIQIISERPGRLNQPDLVAAVGRLKIPTSLITGPRIPIIKDTCTAIDLSANLLQGHQRGYPYDILIVAAGSEPNDFRIPGVKQFCHMFKTEDDLVNLTTQLYTKKSVIVMGAGPTGIELAGRLRYLGHSVTIIEATDQILPGFSSAMQRKAEKVLVENGINILRGSAILEITKGAIRTKQGAILYGTNDLLVWTCGVQPVPLVRALPGSVNDSLQLTGSSDVFIMGDSARRGPPTAQNARQQGEYLAAALNGSQVGPYSYKELGRILDLSFGFLIELQLLGYRYSVYIPTDSFMLVAF